MSTYHAPNTIDQPKPIDQLQSIDQPQSIDKPQSIYKPKPIDKPTLSRIRKFYHLLTTDEKRDRIKKDELVRFLKQFVETEEDAKLVVRLGKVVWGIQMKKKLHRANLTKAYRDVMEALGQETFVERIFPPLPEPTPDEASESVGEKA